MSLRRPKFKVGDLININFTSYYRFILDIKNNEYIYIAIQKYTSQISKGSAYFSEFNNFHKIEIPPHLEKLLNAEKAKNL